MKNQNTQKYHICLISKRKLEKREPWEDLSAVTDVESLRKKIDDIMEANGRVYGIYRKKSLTAVYVFERQQDYFEHSGSKVKLGEKEFDMEKFWYGDCTDALRLRRTVCLESSKECQEKMEEEIRQDLKEQVVCGQVAGVEWNHALMYRKNLENRKNQSSGVAFGYLEGFAMGFIMGIAMDSIPLGLCFGAMLGLIWGNVGVAWTRGKEIDTLDFVRKEGKDNATV